MLHTLSTQKIKEEHYECWFCNNKVEDGVGLCYLCRFERCPRSFDDKKHFLKYMIMKHNLVNK